MKTEVKNIGIERELGDRKASYTITILETPGWFLRWIGEVPRERQYVSHDSGILWFELPDHRKCGVWENDKLRTIVDEDLARIRSADRARRRQEKEQRA